MQKAMRFAVALLAGAAASHANLNKDGLRGYDRIHSAQTLGHARMGIGVFADATTNYGIFQNEQIVRNGYTMQDGTTPALQTTGSITGFTGISAYPVISIGLGNYFDIAAAMPIYYDAISTEPETYTAEDATVICGTDVTCYNATINQGEPGLTGLKKAYPGDIRVNVKLRAPLPEDEYIFDVAALVGGTLSTTNKKKQGLWLREIDYVTKEGVANAYGNQSSTIKAAGLITADFTRLDDPFPVRLNINGGKRIPSSAYSSVLFYGASLEFVPVDFLSIYTEYWSEKADKQIAGQDLKTSLVNAGVVVHTDVGIDLYLSANYNVGSKDFLAVSGEMGDNNYLYGIRTQPDIMAGAGITWNGFLIPQDTDKDGVLDKNDKCPDTPEDEDEFQDEDGCPDQDNDGDGLYDEKDQCPLQKEDVDGFLDEDGCADPDNDGDGVPDTQDRCPNAAEVKNGFETGDGCPRGDKDGDNIADERDGCPTEAEDTDGFEDGDGCPDPDNDKDGVCDPWVIQLDQGTKYEGVCMMVDKCPNQPETVNGVKGKEGCPLNDADQDGIQDEQDSCPSQKEDIDGFQDENGCPDLDNDQDSVLDVADRCLNEAEDKDSFEDSDGCPDPDNDRDGLCDPWVAELKLSDKYLAACKGTDKCPNQAENVNGHQDDDGCADTIRIEKQITLRGVNFKTGTADLTIESRIVLDPIVDQLKGSPEVKIVIEGHTDDVGSDAANQKLSERRAQAVVDYFAFQGIDKSRMQAVGLGEAKPIASNKTAEGRALNRRIEMKRVDN